MSGADRVKDRPPEIFIRVPGNWPSPAQLARALPAGYGLRKGSLRLPDGTVLELHARPRDADFPRVFLGTFRGGVPASSRRRIERSTMLACVVGSGGSLEAARRVTDGATAILLAGGHGTFVDNSGATCLREDWLDMADGTPDAILATLVTRIMSNDEVCSLGMHVAGCRDAVVRSNGDRERCLLDLSLFLLYALEPAAPILNGDLVGDLDGPQYKVHDDAGQFPPPGSPMHNPYGRWRLERLKEGVEELKG